MLVAPRWAVLAGALTLLAEQPLLDLTGCEAADAQAAENGSVITILWRCPGGEAWRVLYKAVGVRPVTLAKPVPSPMPKP